MINHFGVFYFHICTINWVKNPIECHFFHLQMGKIKIHASEFRRWTMMSLVLNSV